MIPSQQSANARTLIHGMGICLLLLISSGFAIPLTDTERAVRLDAAMKAFDQGVGLRSQNPAAATAELQTAVQAFEEVINSGVHNGKLYYNVANAQVLLGRLGPAIANYRRAERLIPGDGNLLENLRYAQSLCRTQILLEGSRAALDTIFFWHHQTSQASRFWVGLCAYLGFWTLLLIRIFQPRFKWLYAGVPLLVLWMVLAGSVTVDQISQHTAREAVVVSDDVILRKGDGENYDPQFKEPIHSGVEVAILDDRNDWCRVRLNDGKEGWMPRAALEII